MTVGRLALTGVAAAGICLPATEAWSMSLGRATLQSALNERLRADIDIPQATDEELSSLRLRVADAEAYRAAGLDYNPALAGAQVSLLKRPDGRTYARIASGQTVTEPFINIMVEANTSSGRLVRTYTLLVDPVRQGPAVAAAITPSVVTPGAQVSGARAAPQGNAAAGPTSGPAALSARGSADTANNGTAAARGVDSDRPDRLRVLPGDTLSGLAARYRSPGVSSEQMQVALFRTNPKAFAGGSMNRLLAGQSLTVPTADAAQQISVAQARADIRAQQRPTSAGNETAAVSPTPASTSDRLKLVDPTVADKVRPSAAAPAPAPAPAPLVAAAPAVAPAVALAGSAPVTSSAAAPSPEASPSVPEAAAASVSASAAASGVAATTTSTQEGLNHWIEKNLTLLLAALSLLALGLGWAVFHLLKLTRQGGPANRSAMLSRSSESRPSGWSEMDSDMPSQIPDRTITRTPPPASSVLPKVPAATPAKPVVQSAVKPQPQPAATLTPKSEPKPTDKPAAMVVPAAASRSFGLSQIDAVSEVDPVAEADVYLGYGRDLQAEEILKEALRRTPERLPIRTKLLEVYAKRRDSQAFKLLATQLYALTGGKGEDWANAQLMGRRLDPEQALYQAGGQPEKASTREGGGFVEPLGAVTSAQSVLPTPSTFMSSRSGSASLDIDLDLGLDFDPGEIAKPTAAGSSGRKNESGSS